MKKEEKLFEMIGLIDENILKETLEMENKNKVVKLPKKIIKIVASVAVIASIILPNTSSSIANAMSEIPLIGKYFEVVTIRNFNETKGNNTINVEVPSINTTDMNDNKEEVASNLNKSVEEYTNDIIENFKENTKGDLGSLDLSYEVIHNTNKWFTLKIFATEIQASGHEIVKYYHINKITDKIVNLSDIFSNDSDYISKISSYIKEQMQIRIKENDESFFIMEIDGEGFSTIDKNQNFYFDENGNLIIVFDEYAVAPGYMGTPEFIIPTKIIDYKF